MGKRSEHPALARGFDGTRYVVNPVDVRAHLYADLEREAPSAYALDLLALRDERPKVSDKIRKPLERKAHLRKRVAVHRATSVWMH
jgi:hypothetical protein